MAKSKAGVGVCAICGEGTVWKMSDGGSYSYTCQHCDFRVYAPAYSDANKAIAKSFQELAAPAAADLAPAAPKVQSKTAKAPAAAAAASAPASKPAAKPAGIWDHLVKQQAAV